MTITTAADITGDNAKHVLGTAGQRARRIFLTSTGANSRFGDTNVAAAQGVELPKDIEVTISASDGDISDSIDLSAAFVYVPSGATLTVSFGV